MASESKLTITEYSPVLKSPKEKEYRKIVMTNEKGMEVEYFLFKNTDPQLWNILEKFESGKWTGEPYFPGFIAKVNGKTLVVPNGRKIEDEYKFQSWKFETPYETVVVKEAITKLKKVGGKEDEKYDDDEFEPLDLDKSRNILTFTINDENKAREKAEKYLERYLSNFLFEIRGIYRSIENENEYVATYTIMLTKW